MKKLQIIIFLLFAVGSSTWLRAQEPQVNPKNVEIAQRFNYFLENGFETIDLLKVGSIDKSFFNLGNPKLVIYDKNDRTKKNLLNSYTLMVEPSDPKIQNKIFPTPSPAFGSGCKQFITMLPAQSKITFTEVTLNVTIPVAVQQAPGSKHKLGPGMLPIAFFLYIK